MTCVVVKTFEARSPFEPNPPKLFRPGDILENVTYASGEMAIFQLGGSPDPLYQLPIKEFEHFIEIIRS
jgi:hypothetical protein